MEIKQESVRLSDVQWTRRRGVVVFTLAPTLARLKQLLAGNKSVQNSSWGGLAAKYEKAIDNLQVIYIYLEEEKKLN